MADDYRADGTRRSGNSGLLIAILIIAALAVAAFATGLIKIGGGEAPKVSVDAGKLPEVETGKVVAGTTETTVDVPDVDVDVDTKKAEVDVPVVGVQQADEPADK